METQYISLNMTPTGVNPCFHISQYDVGRMLGFIVHSGGATVDLDIYTCTIEATRSDGTAITSAVATTDNIGTFEVTPTMSNKTDKYRCQLVIVDANSKRIASLPFDMDVCKAAMDENSESIEEDASLYQQYTKAVQGAIAEANADIQAEENERIAAVNAEATARQTADNTLQDNINSEASTRAAADAVLQGQIDNFVQLPSGSTAADAELVNIRVKANGTTAATAGDAVREQVTELKDDLTAVETYPEYAWTIGKEIHTADGVVVPDSYHAVSEPVNVTKRSILFNRTQQKDPDGKTLVTAIALYNDGVFIRKDSVAYNTTYTFDVDVTSFRLSVGRYSSSGVVFTDADLSLFDFGLIINRPPISELPVATTVASTDKLVIETSSGTKQVTKEKLVKNLADDVAELKNETLTFSRLDIHKNIGLARLTDLSVQDTYYYGTTLNKAVTPGEQYRVTCGKRNVNYSALFYAKDGAYVQGTSIDENMVDQLITVPDGVDTIYLNGSGIYQPVILAADIDINGVAIDAVQKEYADEIYSEFTPTIYNGYKSYNRNAERTAVISHESDPGYHYIELSVKPGESYKITCQAVASSKVYQILDETNYEMISSTQSLSDTIINIPSNAYTLLISYYGDIAIAKREYEISSGGNTIIQNITQTTVAEATFNDNSVIGLINSRSKYRYLWHDNFYRANDATNLGTNGDSLNPMIYSYAGSQLGISGNTAYNTGNTKGFAFADMGVSDCTLEFQADLTDETYTTRGVGVIGRYSDASNYLYCLQRREYIKFGKNVNGVQTELGNIYIVSPAQAPKKVGFELSGNKISVLINGVVWSTVYDDFNENITTHGIVFDGGANGKMLNFGVKRSIEWQTMIDAMDSGTLPFNVRTENVGQSYNFEIENTVVNGSNTALRFENRKSDNYKRSEIAINGGCKMLDEQVFSFDMLLDEDYSVVETLSEIIMQFHDYPDDGDWTAPALQPSFSIFLKNGHYFIHSQWSDDKKSIETGGYDQVSADIGDYLGDIGKWVNWKIHVKWAYNDFFEPILKVYKDGELVFESKKPNVINAANCPYFKVGIYTFNYVENPTACVSEKRTMYVDNVLGWY